MTGDLGRCFAHSVRALELIFNRTPAILERAFAAMFIAVSIGVPLRLIADLKPKGMLGKMIMAGSILGFGLLSFWVGLMLIILFAVFLSWLLSNGRGETVTISCVPWSFLILHGWSHLILPVVNLALFKLSLLICVPACVRHC